MRKTKKLAALMLAGAMGGIPGSLRRTDSKYGHRQQRSPQTEKKAKRQSRQQTARPIRLAYYS